MTVDGHVRQVFGTKGHLHASMGPQIQGCLLFLISDPKTAFALAHMVAAVVLYTYFQRLFPFCPPFLPVSSARVHMVRTKLS